MLSCTMRPISLSTASVTMTVLFMTLAGRVKRMSTAPLGSVISSLWLRN
jgi:hypothetical protein